MLGFSWIIDKRLAGMPRPGVRVPLENDYAFLQGNEVRLLVSLTESSVDPDLAARFDISVLHLPIRDFTAPSIEQLKAFAAEAHSAISQGQAVAVHCGAGMGRTGTMLAAYLVAGGASAREAISDVRNRRPGSIETPEQEQVLYDFEHMLSKEGKVFEHSDLPPTS